MENTGNNKMRPKCGGDPAKTFQEERLKRENTGNNKMRPKCGGDPAKTFQEERLKKFPSLRLK